MGGGGSVELRTGKKGRHGSRGGEINFIQAAAHERRQIEVLKGGAGGGGGGGGGGGAGGAGGGLAGLLGALGGALGGGAKGEKGAKSAQTVTQKVTVTRAATKPTGAIGGGYNGTCVAAQTVTVTVTQQGAAVGTGYASDSALSLNKVLI